MKHKLETGRADDGMGALRDLWEAMDSVRATVAAVAEISDERGAKQARRILAQIDSFEPNVTLIGQVKAGKTALVNALVGNPDLLPSDVNPWTSVITSLHVNSRRRPEGTSALFQFFDESEWDRLISTGGRLGELAERAGFTDEKEEVRQQVQEMREKSRARLGRRFELLLGTSHSYASFDRALIDRYVCFGDWDGEGSAPEGRFADITKTASLYLDLPDFPPGLCFRDTPGVNDTFMMREQITINSIRDSRLCVLVLSAHQAMTTMDLALLRLIANVQAREVVIFINRIDELRNPVTDCAAIEASLRKTLADQGIDRNLTLVFGSAYWAGHALRDTCDTMSEASIDALESWAEGPVGLSYLGEVSVGAPENEALVDLVWALSGVPELRRVIVSRIVEGPGASMLADIRDKAANLVNAEWARDQEVLMHVAGQRSAAPVSPEALSAELAAVGRRITDAFEAGAESARTDVEGRLRAAQDRFVARAVEALLSHLDIYGESEAWQYNPAGLRMMLRTAYISFGAVMSKVTHAALNDACREFEAIFARHFGSGGEPIRLRSPGTARLSPPAAVGQTLVLDLQQTWWRRWWRSLGGQKKALRNYEALIRAETGTIMSELLDRGVPEHIALNRAILAEFIEAQTASVQGLAQSVASVSASGGTPAATARTEVLETARRLLLRSAA